MDRESVLLIMGLVLSGLLIGVIRLAAHARMVEQKLERLTKRLAKVKLCVREAFTEEMPVSVGLTGNDWQELEDRVEMQLAQVNPAQKDWDHCYQDL